MPRGTTDVSAAVIKTVDGISTNDIWDEYVSLVELLNKKRLAITQLLSYFTTQASELVPDYATPTDFEQATEWGVPVSARSSGKVSRYGFELIDYDLASRMSWRFVRDSTRGQIDALQAQIVDADNRNVFRQTLRPLLNPANRFIDDTGATAYALWNSDGSIPAPWGGVTFDSTDSMYLVSGATVIDSGDLAQMRTKLVQHGAIRNGEKMVLLANPQETALIRRFRANQVDSNGSTSMFDFIPSAGAPARLTVEHVEGLVPADDYDGLSIIGSWGDVLIHESPIYPAGYLTMFATGGPNSPLNVIGFRESADPAYQGLQLIPGTDVRYPLTNSFHRHSFGVGVRRRGNAVSMQAKASGQFATPLEYVA